MDVHSSLFESHRAARAVEHLTVSAEPATLTVFLGAFNAKSHLDSLHKILVSQQWTPGVQLLVADNDSDDETFEQLMSIAAQLNASEVSCVKNSKNLGALGSLYLNLDLVKGSWITFIHQDDWYSSTYVSQSLAAARDHELQPVSTVSFDYLTKIGDEAPRHLANPTWFAKGVGDPKKFLENLANHSIPWPCTVFRTTYLKTNLVPFHSSAFLDTELTLLNVTQGNNVYTKTRPMTYSVNAMSGSHSMPSVESETARFASLMRIFSSGTYLAILDSLENDAATEWVKDVISAAQQYFSEPRLREVLQLTVLEISVFRRGYLAPGLNKELAKVYQNFGADSPANILSNLHAEEIDKPEVPRYSGETAMYRTRGIWGWLRLIVSGRVFKVVMKVIPKRLLPSPWKFFK